MLVVDSPSWPLFLCQVHVITQVTLQETHKNIIKQYSSLVLTTTKRKNHLNTRIYPILWYPIMWWIISPGLDIRKRRSRMKRWKNKLLWSLDWNQHMNNAAVVQIAFSLRWAMSLKMRWSLWKSWTPRQLRIGGNFLVSNWMSTAVPMTILTWLMAPWGTITYNCTAKCK